MRNYKRRHLMNIFVPMEGKTGSKQSSKQNFTRDFVEQIKSLPLKPYNCRLNITVIFHFTRTCEADIDNLLKSLFDALQTKGVIENDKFIKKVSAEIKEDAFENGIEIIIYKL